ncbi:MULTISPECIES: hypothetical protein, partial [unclassified Thiocapsa]|uniref:hypothetical protein n=1 Tax=unclassified Thiocapsa TaxID=2641286 RepID=UPI0035B217A3
PVVFLAVDLGLTFDREVLLAVAQLDGRGVAQVADAVFAADAVLAVLDRIIRTLRESSDGRGECQGHHNRCGCLDRTTWLHVGCLCLG